MTIGTIECFAGISGDMLLGALLDAGVSAELLQNAAAALGIGASLRISSVDRSGIRAAKVDVLEHGQIAEAVQHQDHHHDDHHHGHDHGDHDQGLHVDHSHAHEPGSDHAESSPHSHSHSRNWPQIRALITAASLPDGARRIALRAFELLAEAEAKVHGIPVDQVHFHEVGAVDTITDIVCASVGLDALHVNAWRCSAINTGSGFVHCAHGRFPVPAPATAELLRGLPTYAAGPTMELTTPTGAAMLRALGCTPSDASPVAVSALGYGAGNRNPEGFANVLRLSVGTPAQSNAQAGAGKSSFSHDRVVVLECALDDATPQILAHAMELALEQGALDVMAAPVTMKKSRPGTLLTVLARPQDEDALTRLLFRETTTLGIRRRDEDRAILDREFVTVDTHYGRIRVKIASVAGEILNAMPEYEDCRRAAREHDIPLRAAIEAARTAWAESQAEKAKA